MSRLKFLGFATAAMAGSVTIMVAGLLAADLYAHSRVERSVGVNRHGYRGPVVGRKPSGTPRIVVLGGSTVFGWEVALEETIPAALERLLREQHAGGSVVNLGFIGEGAHAFLPTLQDFSYLDYDLVCLYEGYNDLLGDARPNTDLFRHESPVFRLTGYFPVLPLVLREKAFALRFGSVGTAYTAGRESESTKTVFRPNLANRTSAAALEAAANVTTSLGRQLDRLAAEPVPQNAPVTEAGCAAPWGHYCQSVFAAVKYALAQGKTVLVVLQPRLRNDRAEHHAGQQRALASMVESRFDGEPRVRLVDLSDTVDLSRKDLAIDGMHLNAAGNTIIAAALIDPIRAAVVAERGEAR